MSSEKEIVPELLTRTFAGSNSKQARSRLQEVVVTECGCSRLQHVALTPATGQLSPRCSTSTAKLRGLDQKVISYSMYGDIAYFLNRTRYLASVSEQFYPSADGWSVRVYHDADKLNDKALTERLCNLTCKFGHLEFCDMSRLPEPAMKYNKKGVHPMLWRFMPMHDPAVDLFLSRDLDSYFLEREADTVQKWIETGLPLYAARDHPAHRRHIMGGLWGARRVGTYGDRINWRKIEDDILQISEHMYTQERFQRDTHDVDQKALKVVLYPRVCSLRQYEVQLPKQSQCIIFDSYSCTVFKDSIPFPSKRPENISHNFLGADDGYPPIFEECPRECRPQDHKDWIYC